MPELLAGRELVNKYLDDNKISITSLGVTYGKGRMYMAEVLSGKKKNPAANQLILKIIDDFQIRPKGKEE